jgi:hypothetical protein
VVSAASKSLVPCQNTLVRSLGPKPLDVGGRLALSAGDRRPDARQPAAE